MTATALAPQTLKTPSAPPVAIRKRTNWLELPIAKPVRASLDKYIELTETSEQKLDYHEGKIIAMGDAKITHEQVIGNIITILNNLFRAKSGFRAMGSNVKTYIPGLETPSFYNADVIAVKDKPEIREISTAKRRLKALANPWIIAEVLSDSTARHDWEVKIPNYRRIESLEYIIIADHRSIAASLMSRVPGTKKWITEDFYKLDETLQIEEKKFQLSEFYFGLPIAPDGQTIIQDED